MKFSLQRGSWTSALSGLKIGVATGGRFIGSCCKQGGSDEQEVYRTFESG